MIVKIQQLIQRIIAYLRGLSFVPHFPDCKYCNHTHKKTPVNCRKLHKIERKVELLTNVKSEQYEKMSVEKLKKTHEKIKTLEDELREVQDRQPSEAAEQLRQQLRFAEVRVRGHLPKPTTEELLKYIEKLENQP